MRPRDHRRTNQIKSLPFLSCRSSERLAIFPTFGIHHDLERPQETVLEKYFPASRATQSARSVKYGQEIDRRSQRRSTVQQDSNRSTKLISIMASNTQQFGTRYDDPPRKSNEVSVAAFDDRLNELTSLVKKLAVERTQHVKACGICTSHRHTSLICAQLQEGPTEHADAIGGFFGQQQRRYDPFSNTYNPGWKDHPNLVMVHNRRIFKASIQTTYAAPSNPKQGTHLEDMMKSLISNTQQIQQNTQQQSNSSTKCSAIPTKHSNEYSEFGVSNESAASSNASAIVLRSGKELQENTDENGTKRGHAQQRENQKKRFAKSKKDEEAKEILETFRKVEVNIPLLDAIKTDTPLRKVSQGTMHQQRNGGCHSARRPISCLPRRSSRRRSSTVNELVFPADFYVLDMREDNSPSSTSILLGRPFLKTARTKIDVHTVIPTALFVDAFDPFVQKFPAIDDKDYIKLALEESPMPMKEENMGVDPLVQVNAKFDGDSVFLAKINKDLTYGPRTYKNKAFHDKISSRKNSLMNIKVLIGPHHLRKHYIEEVDSECPTYS
ncbi:UNVERIFIED_CONTAM: hypothetical protein Sangu_2739700, partial [Sesamum angustifolium]